MMYGLRRGQQMREEYYPECMSVSRRVFLGAVPAALAAQSAAPGGIDRRAVVSRHNPTLHRSCKMGWMSFWKLTWLGCLVQPIMMAMNGIKPSFTQLSLLMVSPSFRHLDRLPWRQQSRHRPQQREGAAKQR